MYSIEIIESDGSSIVLPFSESSEFVRSWCDLINIYSGVSEIETSFQGIRATLKVVSDEKGGEQR